MDIEPREILERYNIYYEDSSNDKDLLYLCPFHDDTRIGSARMDMESGIYNCWSCKNGGNIYKFVSQMENITVDQAYRLVVNNFNQPQTYDIAYLKAKTLRVYSLKKSYSVLATKIVAKILATLKTKCDTNFTNRWMAVCHWIYYTPTAVQEVNKKYDEVIEIYSQFNQELKTL